jgi:hypothetical protein
VIFDDRICVEKKREKERMGRGREWQSGGGERKVQKTEKGIK